MSSQKDLEKAMFSDVKAPVKEKKPVKPVKEPKIPKKVVNPQIELLNLESQGLDLATNVGQSQLLTRLHSYYKKGSLSAKAFVSLVDEACDFGYVTRNTIRIWSAANGVNL